MSNGDGDRPEERSPGASDEGTEGAEQQDVGEVEEEGGGGDEPDDNQPDAWAEAPSEIDIEEIRPEIEEEMQDREDEDDAET